MKNLWLRLAGFRENFEIYFRGYAQHSDQGSVQTEERISPDFRSIKLNLSSGTMSGLGRPFFLLNVECHAIWKVTFDRFALQQVVIYDKDKIKAVFNGNNHNVKSYCLGDVINFNQLWIEGFSL
jgi:hypothetical protein